jgi:hypothetical protein
MINKIYQGKSAHRYKENPLEKAFAEEWAVQSEQHKTPEYLLFPSSQVCYSEVDADRRLAMNTVVQWLGSPVGQGFLLEVLARPEAKHFLERLVREPGMTEMIKKLVSK